MDQRFARTRLLLGEEGLRRLAVAHVAVFGLGGVGSYVAEALARAGIGALSLFDGDVVEPSNCNRQLVALQSTIGLPKARVMGERVQDINPQARVHVHHVFYMPDNAADYPLSQYDYIVDAMDRVTAKLLLATCAAAAGVPMIAAMGAGNKLDPTAFRVADINDTRVCPLARTMRRELKKRGVDALKVVYSEEAPASSGQCDPARGRPVVGSCSFVPPVAGMILAGEVVKDLLASGKKGEIDHAPSH